MRYRANKKVTRWLRRRRQRQRQRRRQQDPHQKQYVPLPFGGGHNSEDELVLHKIYIIF